MSIDIAKCNYLFDVPPPPSRARSLTDDPHRPLRVAERRARRERTPSSSNVNEIIYKILQSKLVQLNQTKLFVSSFVRPFFAPLSLSVNRLSCLYLCRALSLASIALKSNFAVVAVSCPMRCARS